jgi:hypothetical protein
MPSLECNRTIVYASAVVHHFWCYLRFLLILCCCARTIEANFSVLIVLQGRNCSAGMCALHQGRTGSRYRQTRMYYISREIGNVRSRQNRKKVLRVLTFGHHTVHCISLPYSIELDWYINFVPMKFYCKVLL